MKRTLTLLSAILMLSCNQNSTTKELENKKTESNAKTEINGKFDWLNGKWKRLNEEAGKETFENWDKISETEYSGIGFTMQNGDTIKQERIKLTESNGIWTLTVKVPEEKESITFKMTELKDYEFVCKNDSIDFPKKIRYWSEGEKLKAEVSNDEMKIPFEFEKIK